MTLTAILSWAVLPLSLLQLAFSIYAYRKVEREHREWLANRKSRGEL